MGDGDDTCTEIRGPSGAYQGHMGQSTTVRRAERAKTSDNTPAR